MSKSDAFIAHGRFGEAAVSMSNLIALTVFAILAVIGLSFGLHSLIVGHESTFNTTRYVPWGLLIASYVFFASMSTGICIIFAIAQTFNISMFKPLLERVLFLAIITIAAGLMSISLELENPWRVPIYGIISANPHSNIWWKSTIYSIYFALLVVNLIMLQLNRHKTAVKIGLVALVACLLANLNMKADMSVIGSRLFWRDNYMPIYFIIQSVTLGCSAIILFNWIAIKLDIRIADDVFKSSLRLLSKILAFLLLLSSIFMVMKIYAGFYSDISENQKAMILLMKGDYAFNFWLGEFLLGFILPLMLLIMSRASNLALIATASLASLVGIFYWIYDLVIIGQLVPVFSQYNFLDFPEYWTYTPSLHEIMLFIGAIFVIIAAFIAWELFYKIRPYKTI